MEEDSKLYGYFEKLEKVIKESTFVEEVMLFIDNNIDLHPSEEFKDIWKSASANFKRSVTKEMVNCYVKGVIKTYGLSE